VSSGSGDALRLISVSLRTLVNCSVMTGEAPPVPTCGRV
jgi:hypothetical protein